MKVEFGNIVTVHSHSFLSIGIQFFENMWRWLGFKWKPFWANIPNHIAMGDKDNKIIEAIGQGVFSQPFDRPEFLEGTKTVKVYSYPWTSQQKKVISRVYNDSEGREYQKVNFLQYIVYIMTFGGIWLGRKGVGNKMYCSELGAQVMYEATDRWNARTPKDSDAHVYFRDFWKISPHQMSIWVEKHCKLESVYTIKDGVVQSETHFLDGK